MKKILFLILLLSISPHCLSMPSFHAETSEIIGPPILIGEKHLIKLMEVIQKRMEQQSDTFKVIFTANLSNSSYFTTEKLSDITTYENPSSSKIISIKIVAKTIPSINTKVKMTSALREKFEDELVALLEIDNPEIKMHIGTHGISFEVSGADRDWVITTNIDLKERSQLFSKDNGYVGIVLKIIFSAIGLVAIFLSFAQRYRKTYNKKYNEEIPILKYIFNFNDPDLSMKKNMIAFQSGLIGGVAGYLLASKITSHFYPHIVFYFGDEITVHSSLISQREFLVIGVFLALVVGIIASVIGNMVSSKINSNLPVATRNDDSK